MEINYRKLRLELGLQQKQLAEKTNLSVNTITRIETYKVDPKLSNVCNILNTLGYELVLKKK